MAYQIAARGVQVSIVIPDEISGQLDEADQYLLASMADSPHISILGIKKTLSCGGGWLLAEAIGEHSVSWACDTPFSLHFNSEWGQHQNILVQAPVQISQDNDLQVTDASQLRPVGIIQGDREIELHSELNGSLQDFGRRFWNCITREHEPSNNYLTSADEIISLDYQDRYLFTPLSVRVLYEILKQLCERVLMAN